MYAIIKPIKTQTGGQWARPVHITADGASLAQLVALAYLTDSYHIDWRMPKDDRTYRAAFRVPEERQERLLPYMQQTLANLFGVQAHWESQEHEVYVLRRVEGHAALQESKAPEESLESIHGTITLRRQPVRELCDFLTGSFGTVVIDETGTTGRYDFDVPYQHGQPEVAAHALMDIGLETVKARRNIQILVVAPEGAAQGKQP
jgi:uncharacterized protein (TIGR03435 family)